MSSSVRFMGTTANTMPQMQHLCSFPCAAHALRSHAIHLHALRSPASASCTAHKQVTQHSSYSTRQAQHEDHGVDSAVTSTYASEGAEVANENVNKLPLDARVSSQNHANDEEEDNSEHFERNGNAHEGEASSEYGLDEVRIETKVPEDNPERALDDIPDITPTAALSPSSSTRVSVNSSRGSRPPRKQSGASPINRHRADDGVDDDHEDAHQRLPTSSPTELDESSSPPNGRSTSTTEVDGSAHANERSEASLPSSPSSPSSPSGSRLINPRRPVRKGVKPPTRGEAVAFKLTTKTDTNDVQAPPLLLVPSFQGNVSNPPALSSASNPSVPPRSPHLGSKPGGSSGPGGAPNFAAQALNVQLKKTAGAKKPMESSASAPVPPPKIPPSPPPVPPRKGRARSLTSGDISTEIKEDGKQGFLNKRGGIFKGWKKRWFVLKDGKLYYYNSQKTDTPLGVISDVYKVDKHQSKDKEFCFAVYSPKRTYHCSADTSEELDAWMEGISAIITTSATTTTTTSATATKKE